MAKKPTIQQSTVDVLTERMHAAESVIDGAVLFFASIPELIRVAAKKLSDALNEGHEIDVDDPQDNAVLALADELQAKGATLNAALVNATPAADVPPVPVPDPVIVAPPIDSPPDTPHTENPAPEAGSGPVTPDVGAQPAQPSADAPQPTMNQDSQPQPVPGAEQPSPVSAADPTIDPQGSRG